MNPGGLADVAGDDLEIAPVGQQPGSLSLGAARGPDFESVAYVDGLENPTENFTNICGWLVRNGYGDDAIRAVIGETSTGRCRPCGSALDLPGPGARRALAIPGLSDKDLTVKV
jgi:hypothetical protein